MPRHTIHLSKQAAEIIGGPPSPDKGPDKTGFNLSGRINSVIIRYHRATTAETPPLTVAQWLFLCDMLNGTFIEDNTGDYLWADISESGKLDGLAEKWEVDAEAFSAAVRALPPAALYGILDVVAAFWRLNDQDHADRTAHLTAAGAKIA